VVTRVVKPPKLQWVLSKPSQHTIDRHGGGKSPGSRRQLARYGNVWHAARAVQPARVPAHHALGLVPPELRTLCGRDVPPFWDKPRKSEPTKLKESERLCQICVRAETKD
jgi:hypothetical protein